MLWMLPVAGAALGAMSNRKNPLKGAAVGGLLGAGGAYAAPALMGTGAGAAGSYGAGAFGTAAGYGGAGAATTMPAAAGSTAGGAGLLGTVGQYAKTGLTAMQAAQTAKGLLGGQEQAPQMAPQQITGPQTLAQLSQSNEQGIGALMDEQTKRRMMNQQIIQQMMGRQYG